MKPRPKVVDRILKTLEECRTLCIVGHVRPDGDCVGSQLGLALALRQAGKEVTVWNEDRAPDKLAFLDPDHSLERPSPGRAFDAVIAVDVANVERLGHVADHIQERRWLINIDHHASNTRFGDVNWIGAREPSTGELVFRLLKWAGWPITPRIADCLFTAVSTDTGSFQYATTRPATFSVAGELVKRGANLARICHEVYQSFSLSRVRLVRHVYNHFRLTHNNQIAYLWLKPADFSRTGAETADAEGLIDHLRSMEPVVIACLFEEVAPDLIRVSLRSKRGDVDVNQVAVQFGGGGHPGAAGARIAGRPLAVQRRIIAALKHALNAAA
ncbi:MAG TPA: bifunctional oligoribonuclease/PAP phosphatase NrnA [Verrucomicrobiota bacterium]|nr:bifunctional oligoribonuclease/PAP phosphatase NrnA [Verrucomicrobiota bacterium]HNU49742.1 bifunctional oligoribonuclease/PAP phosphatase NrnA [Verrucomicrobiota bacterium]